MTPRFDLTVPQALRHHAEAHGDRVAVRQKEHGIWKPVPWRRLHERARHVGLGLRALGLPDGGHVGVLSENRIEWVLTQLGTGLVGGVVVGVYPTSPAGEVAYVLAHAEARVVVCEDQEQSDKILDALGELPGLRRIVVLESKGLADTKARAPELVVGFDELEAAGAAAEAAEAAFLDGVLARQTLDAIALLIYTSGSTGKPKGAMLSFGNVAAMARGAIDRLGLDARTTHLSYLPLCHVAEQMLTVFVPLYLGSRVDFGESIRTVQEDLREVGPTMFLGVPRIWEKLHSGIAIKLAETGPLRRALHDRAVAACRPFAFKDASERSLRERLVFAFWWWLVLRALHNFVGLRRARVALTGAAPISAAVVAYFRAIGVPLLEVYGMTETSGMVLGQRRTGIVPATVGVPTLGTECRVGERGELQVHGPCVFQGYWRNPEATAEAIADGWLRTGDVVDTVDGQFRIVDRLKDIMITAGGKNLTPSEVENAMKASPFIKECVIVADARRFVAALIQIEYDTVALWAQTHGVTFTHFRSLAEHPRVRELVQREVDAGNARLAPVAQIRRFHLLAKELDHDDGEVTATMKVRRASVYKAYAADIEALYG